MLHSSVTHPKFIGLTSGERGTWLVALVLADIAHPEPVHESAVRLYCPDASFDQLYERKLIEPEVELGWFRVHDLRQFHLIPSETPEAMAERQRRSRKRRTNGVTDVTGVTKVTPVTDVTVDETIRDETIRENVKGPKSESRSRANVRGFERPIETIK